MRHKDYISAFEAADLYGVGLANVDEETLGRLCLREA